MPAICEDNSYQKQPGTFLERLKNGYVFIETRASGSGSQNRRITACLGAASKHGTTHTHTTLTVLSHIRGQQNLWYCTRGCTRGFPVTRVNNGPLVDLPRYQVLRYPQVSSITILMAPIITLRVVPHLSKSGTLASTLLNTLLSSYGTRVGYRLAVSSGGYSNHLFLP